MKTLHMVFENVSGKKISLNVADPKDDLTKAQVDAAMQTIIAKNVFTSTGGDLIKSVESQIIVHDTNALA